MKRQKVFVLGVITLAISQAAYAEMGMLPEVSVTSTTIDDRFDSKRGEPSNTNIISGKKVDDEHGKNLLDVLESIPGVTAELQSGDSIKIMLRGVENQRYMGEKPGVAIVIDGVPVNERTGRVNVDLDNIESIKVIKGGASYLYGEDALSGAVVITTKRGAKMAGFTASAETGNFQYHKGLMRAGFSKNDWIGHIQTSTAKALDYYYQGNYYRHYTDGKLQYLVDGTSDVTFGFESSKRNKDSHGTVRGAANALLDPKSFNSLGAKDYARKYDVGLNKLYLTYAKDFESMGNLMLNTYSYADHTNFWQGGAGVFLRNAAKTNLGSIGNFNDAFSTGVDQNQVQRGAKAEWRKDGERNAFMAGLDTRRDNDRQKQTALTYYSAKATPTNTTTNLLIAPGQITGDFVNRINTNALYGEGKFKVADPLTLTLNVRHDDLKIGYEDYLNRLNLGTKFKVWSERLGANYSLSPTHELYGNLSTGFRTPTAQQLYAGSITPTGAVASNPNLKPEHSLNQEIGLRSKTEWLEVPLDIDVALFQLDRKDFILNQGGQYSKINGTALTDMWQNVGGVRNRGLELALKTNASQTWSGDVAYTYLDARFTRNDSFYLQTGPMAGPTYTKYNATGNVVPRTPRHKLNFAGRYRPMEKMTVTAEVNTQSGLYADELNWIWVGGRTVTNLMASYEFKSDTNTKWSLFARADNLFNRFYYSTIRASSDSSGNQDGKFNIEDASIVVNPGRVLTAGLTVNF
ncbi:MAG: TonB-dependent receptor [Gallionella sp.]|nr:TonB-dependent receptor [Gallionella sp.]